MPTKKKKIAMMVAMAAAVLVVASVGSGPAWAQMIWGVIQCDSDPCYATGAHEVVFEQVGDGVADNIYAQGGHDNLRAQNYTNDTDTAHGGYGNDVLHVNDGDTLDGAIGGPGFDICVVDATIEAADTCEQVVVR
jgi:Ca2+-binding RTX toxin-like protein